MGNYSTVGWSCRAIESKMAKDKKLRDRIEKIIGSIHQLQEWGTMTLKAQRSRIDSEEPRFMTS